MVMRRRENVSWYGGGQEDRGTWMTRRMKGNWRGKCGRLKGEQVKSGCVKVPERDLEVNLKIVGGITL